MSIDDLDAVLEEARALGFLGPSSIAAQRRHAEAFLDVLRPAPTVLDLGSGGGMPGLVLAAHMPESRVVLLDGRQRRTDFLQRAVRRLGWTEHVTVLAGRAEALGHDLALRRSFDAVVARGFGPPAATAECAAAFLRVGGQLVVSEPPEPSQDRWHAAALHELGLGLDARHGDAPVASLTQVAPCPSRYPRRSLRPTLW